MATKYWLGIADAVAQLVTVTVGGTLSGETFQILIDGDVIAEHTDSDTSVDTAAGALATAWNASTDPRATGITATDTTGTTTGTLTLEADTAGVPFTITLNTPGGSATLGQATTRSSAGPNDWSTAENWSSGAVPVNGDDVVIVGGANICWGLAQSAVTLDSLKITRTFTGRIGLDYRSLATSADGANTDSTRAEYRETHLTIGASVVDIGEHSGPGSPSGSGRICLDLGSAASQVTVHSTAATPVDSTRHAIRLLANSASTDIHVRSARAGVGIAADEPGETSVVGDVTIVDTTTYTRVEIGDGCTLTNWAQHGGRGWITAAATITSVDLSGGELRLEGVRAVTTVDIRGGSLHANNVPSSGSAITTATVDGGTLDGSESSESRTWGTVTVRQGSTLVVPEDVSITTLSITGTQTVSFS